MSTLLFYEDPAIFLHPLFLNCVHPLPPFPCHFQPSPQLCFLLSSFFGWDHATFDELFYLWYNMDLRMSSLTTLVPEWPWCVFYAKDIKFTVVWDNVVFYCYSDLKSHTQAHTEHTRASRGTHSYIYTTCYVLMAATFITLND